MKKQMGEMEQGIKQKAHSLAYRVTLILLGAWALYESGLVLFTSAEHLNVLPVFVLTVSMLVSYFSELALKRKMIEGDEEYAEPNKIIRAAVFIVIVAIIIMSVVAFSVVSRG